nr:ISNCY family transposase [Rhizobium sp. Q54]
MTTFSLVETMSGRIRYVLLDHLVTERAASPRSHLNDLDERLSVVQAADLLDLNRSQIHRLLRANNRDGQASVERSEPARVRAHSDEFRMRRST